MRSETRYVSACDIARSFLSSMVHITCAAQFKIHCLCKGLKQNKTKKKEQAVVEKLNRIAGVTPAPAMY